MKYLLALAHQQLWNELQPLFSLFWWAVDAMLEPLLAAHEAEMPLCMLSRSEVKFLLAD